MGLLDGLLGQVTENFDIQNLAAQIGLTPEQVEGAVAALGQAHVEPGDTVSLAAQNTGLGPEVLQQIVAAIGGEGSLGRFASLLTESGGLGALLGQQGGGAGNLLGDLASGLFRKG